MRHEIMKTCPHNLSASLLGNRLMILFSSVFIAVDNDNEDEEEEQEDCDF